LVAEIAVERDVTLEQGGCLAEVATSGVRQAQKGRCEHLDRAVVERPREAQRLRSELERLDVVAGVQALDDREGDDPREPVRRSEFPGEHLCFVQVFAHAYPVAEGQQRVSKIQPDVDGQLGRRTSLGQTAKNAERLLEMTNGLPIGCSRYGAK